MTLALEEKWEIELRNPRVHPVGKAQILFTAAMGAAVEADLKKVLTDQFLINLVDDGYASSPEEAYTITMVLAAALRALWPDDFEALFQSMTRRLEETVQQAMNQ